MPVKPFILGTILPIAIFPVILVLASEAIPGYIKFTGTLKQLRNQCDTNASAFSAGPYSLPYTYIPFIDDKLCSLVTLFHALMHPSNAPFTIDTLASLSVFAIMPYVESARFGRSFLLAFPVLVGLIFQTITLAITWPAYTLILICAGQAGLHRWSPTDARVHQSSAEAILFSVVIGYALPTAAMLTLDNPYVTALWQVFPLWISLSYSAYKMFYTSTAPGNATIRSTYLLLAAITATVHALQVWPLLITNRSELYRLFVFSLSSTVKGSTSLRLSRGVLGFIQLDGTFSLVTALLGSFWFAGSFGQLVGLMVWWPIGIVLVGPGATFASVLAWRESNASKLADTNARKLQ